jgi:HD domain
MNPELAGKLTTMLLTMADVRAVLAKLAERLHNLRSMGGMLPHSRQRLAEETLQVRELRIDRHATDTQPCRAPAPGGGDAAGEGRSGQTDVLPPSVPTIEAARPVSSRACGLRCSLANLVLLATTLLTTLLSP